MKLEFRITLVSLIVSCLALVALPRPAGAHPLGNFTVNQYSALTVGQGRVDVVYVVDMAEIPAFQELGTIRADHSTDLTPAERDGYVSRKSAELARGLSLSVDGRPARLSVSKTALSFPPGAGGLPTLRFEMYLTAPLDTAQKGSLEYKVGNFNERIGWREIIAAPAGGTSFESASVPATDRSNALRTYSSDLMTSPPGVTSASLVFVPSAGARQAGAQQAAPLQQPGSVGAVREPPLLGWAQGRADVLTDLIARKDLPLGAFLVALLVAFGFGAGHALSPGHGKTVVAAYLVGSRGTPAHAALLG